VVFGTAIKKFFRKKYAVELVVSLSCRGPWARAFGIHAFIRPWLNQCLNPVLVIDVYVGAMEKPSSCEGGRGRGGCGGNRLQSASFLRAPSRHRDVPRYLSTAHRENGAA